MGTGKVLIIVLNNYEKRNLLKILYVVLSYLSRYVKKTDYKTKLCFMDQIELQQFI